MTTQKPETIEQKKAPEEKKTEAAPAKFSVTVTSQGSGEPVQKGDKIKAHYHGTLLDGTKFDSSYDRNQPLPFTVGSGQVIKCWDEGFQGLSKGAKADLICPPDYAYGSRAMGPIPANSVLKFSIEVVDIVSTAKPKTEEKPVEFSVTVTEAGKGYAV